MSKKYTHASFPWCGADPDKFPVLWNSSIYTEPPPASCFYTVTESRNFVTSWQRRHCGLNSPCSEWFPLYFIRVLGVAWISVLLTSHSQLYGLPEPKKGVSKHMAELSEWSWFSVCSCLDAFERPLGGRFWWTQSINRRNTWVALWIHKMLFDTKLSTQPNPQKC